MLQSKARWKINELEHNNTDDIVSHCNISPLVAQLLAVRGITDKDEIERFLSGGLDHFHDPFLLDGMAKAVERIRQALDRGEKIRVYGDYDADGVCSTSLMIFLMQTLGADFDYYIPHRANEGYGLNHAAMNHAKESGVSLIVTVDTGISACEQIEYASQLGIDVIVTDHHEPPETLPNAFTLINPKKPDCSYPYKHLAGVGVALKLAHALLGRVPMELVQIASVGTIADLMPLTGENRCIVKLGLEQIQQNPLLGIRALLNIARVEYQTTNAGNIAFALAPRINASGRLNSADHAVKLMISTNDQEAEQLARQLDELNKERQRIVDEITKQAMEQIENTGGIAGKKVIVLAQEDWNVGVIGIVAAKILEKFYLPTIILSIDAETGMAKGSARSIAGFDIYRALTACRDLLDHFGGHQAAAGMSLHRDEIPAFAGKLQQLAEEWLTEDDYIPIYSADMKCSLEDVTLQHIKEIEALAPFGMGNPSPKFVFAGLPVDEIKPMGKDRQHLKFSFANDQGITVEALAFGKGALSDLISSAAKVDVLGELSINEWNGIRKPQIVIQDIRVSHLQFFDWRGKNTTVDRLLTVLRKVRSEEVGSCGQAIVISDPEELNLLPEPVRESGCGIWCAASGSALTALNEQAESFPLNTVEDVFLYSLPIDTNTISYVLRKCSKAKRIYAVFQDLQHGTRPSTLPSRDTFKQVYSMIAHQPESEYVQLLKALCRRSGLSEAVIHFIIQVFEELGFVEKRGNVIQFITKPDKKPLSESLSYRKQTAREEVEQTLIYCSSEELFQWLQSQMDSSSHHQNIMEDAV